MNSKVFCAAAIAAALGSVPAHAQGARDPYVPAELPPASFTGEQYVDSTGCAFIRAGFSGQVNWVPRFDRERRPVCGLPPSIPRASVAAAPEPATTQPAPRPEPPRAEVQVQREAPRPTVQAQPQPLPPRASVRSPAPVPLQPEPSYQMHVGGQASGSCWNYDPVGQQWTYGPSLRCGPQGLHPSDDRATVRPDRRVVHPAPPQHQFPQGYRPAWRDDRLNPYRAQGTPLGEAQMRRIWSDEVPMRLIDPRATLPYAHAAPVPAPSKVPSVAAPPAPLYHDKGVHLSSRGSAVRQAVPAAPPAGSGHSYVQIGSFGVPENARDAAQRFQAMGLPVRMAQVRSGVRTLEVVLVGPFASQEDLRAALDAARRAGFRDAFTRG